MRFLLLFLLLPSIALAQITKNSWVISGSNLYPISSISNIGIGSTNPGSALDVNGTIRIPQGDMQIVNGNVGIGTSFISGAGEAALTVMNGNVGIGTWVPNNLLTVKGNLGIGTVGTQSFQILTPDGSLTAPFLARTTATNTGLYYKTDNSLWFTVGGTAVWGAASANVLGLSNGVRLGFSSGDISTTSADTYLKRIGATVLELTDANTNMVGKFLTNMIGVGTTAPTAQLSVVGNIGIGTVSGDLYLKTAPPSGGMIVEGNVGVGSTAPGQALDVVGTIRALSGGTCTTLYQCVGGVDAGVIQTSACLLCPAGSCTKMNGCF